MGLLRNISRQPAIAVMVAAGLVVAACGSGSSGSTSTGGNAASSSTSPRGTAPSSRTPTRGTPASGTTTPARGTPASGGTTPARGTPASGSTSPGTWAKITYASGQATVIGKSTDVVVNTAAAAALRHAGITVTPVAPATSGTTLLFPVSGGQMVIATLAGTIDHSGGLTFRHGGKSVALTSFVINTSTRRLTATVSGAAVPVFDLNLASSRHASGPNSTVIASNIVLGVTNQAATTLNSDLGVSTFKAGMTFGVASLTVAYAGGHR